MKLIYNPASFYCFLLLGISYHADAQLTVFNVSSSDITDKGKISAQQQFEINDQIESSTTATYGLGGKWEAGLNLINLDYSVKNRHFEINDTTTAVPFAPLLLANAQKVFELNNTLSIGVGTVAGANLGHAHRSNLVYYKYSIWSCPPAMISATSLPPGLTLATTVTRATGPSTVCKPR